MPVNENQIAWFAESYRETTGESPKRFVCPITLKDDPEAVLCDGHILCDGIKTARRDTVPQRTDVDNAFGSLFEGDFVRFVNIPTQTPEELVQRTNSLAITGPDGEVMQAFFSRSRVVGRQRLDMFDASGNVCGQPYLKEHSLEPRHYKQLEVTFTHWFNRYSFTAALLKTAYLTMFKIFGYQWVNDSLGDRVRRALRDSLEVADRKEAMRVFASFEGCAREMFTEAIAFSRGTLEDGSVLCHYAEGDARSGTLFAVTCLYWINHRLFAATVPWCNRPGFHFVAMQHYSEHVLRAGWSHSVHFARIREGIFGIEDTPLPMGVLPEAAPSPIGDWSATYVKKP